MIVQKLFMILPLCLSLRAFKILVFYPFPSYSHQRAILALTERLVNVGHELYVIGPNAVPSLRHHTNYTFVDLSPAYTLNQTRDEDEIFDHLQDRISKWALLSVLKDYHDVPRRPLLSEEYSKFKQRVKSEQIQFDLVIAEFLFFQYACAIIKDFPGSPPLISMSSGNIDITEQSLGSKMHLSFTPLIFSEYTDRMSLWQKIENWLSGIYIVTTYENRLDAAVRRYQRENHGPENDGILNGCRSKCSLSLIASNPLYFYPRTLSPNVIEVGPLHLKPPEKLPKVIFIRCGSDEGILIVKINNLQDWLDGAEVGVIYFSLGCTRKGKTLPAGMRANFLKFFRELPLGYRVLWKWELDGKIPGQSDNILAQKWLPQESVLAHPKVKLFIMQGGLQSFQEAVHFGVPIVGIPWFADQECNIAKIVDAGVGVQLMPQDLLSYEEIKSALEAVLHDRKYSDKMARLSAISRDFTSRGMDEAVFWVEHVARHGGASHLRPATADTTLFQYFCLDIISLVIISCSLVLYATYYLSKMILSTFLKKLNTKVKSS